MGSGVAPCSTRTSSFARTPSTFVREDIEHGGWEHWPVTYKDLEPRYARHEESRREAVSSSSTRLTAGRSRPNALREASEQLGLEWYLPKLAVTFAPNGGAPVPGVPIVGGEDNLHGSPRLTCRLCGECNFGCNYGSKDTLDFNYLSLAKLRRGVDIARGARRRRSLRGQEEATPSATSTTPRPSRASPPGAPPRADDHRRPARPLLRDDRLDLFLLKNRANFPGLSERLGTRFCGNGDLLTFVMRTHETVGGKRRGRQMEPGYGPVITSTIRVKDALEGGPGARTTSRTAAIPETINWIIDAGDQPAALMRGIRFAWRLLKLYLKRAGSSDVGARSSRLIGPAPTSSTTLPLFAMGRDIPDGNMRLTSKGLLDVDWNKRRSIPLRSRAPHGRDIAKVLDGKFKDNPPWYVGRVVTVHPLGGCPMGRNEQRGRRRLVRAGLRLPGLRHRRRVGHARPIRTRTPRTRSPHWPTASPRG